MTQNQEQKIILEKESSDIAKAVSTNPVLTKQGRCQINQELKRKANNLKLNE